jgi:cytochrome c oxidase subunit II
VTAVNGKSAAVKAMAGGLVLFGAMLPGAWPASESIDLARVQARTPDVAHGAKLYETCAACHGARGEGVRDGTVPAIAGQPVSVIAKQLVDFRTGKRMDPRMQHFADTTHLSYSQEVADVAAYVSRLDPSMSSTTSDTDAGGGRGAALYVRRCERCHGAMAEGNDAGFAPRLAGQHAEYVKRQLSEGAETRPALKSAHASVADALTSDNIAALAATLSSL